MESSNNAEEQYRKYYNSIQESITFCQDMLDKRLFALSSGGLALSFTVFSFLLTHNYQLNKCCVVGIWGLFGLAIILNVVSHLCSLIANTKTLNGLKKDIADPKIKEFDNNAINKKVRKRNAFITVLNSLEFGIVIIAISFALVFTICIFVK